MRRLLSLAVGLCSVILTANGLFAVPAISGISPTSGNVGTLITISGSGFGSTQGLSTVKFNGVVSTPTSWGSRQIVAPIPATATSGTIIVTVNGVNSNPASYAVIPNIASLSPNSGPVGTVVTISGFGFGPTQGSGFVRFNGVYAPTSTWSATSITVAVPSWATTGNVVVIVSGQVSNGVPFTVSGGGSAPSITSLSPTSGPTGTALTINGSGFGGSRGNSTVTFNGYFASTFNSWSANSIVVVVPATAPTGVDNVVVTVGGVASAPATFTVTNPSINSISVGGVAMNASPETQLITINGTNFGASQGTNSSVSFNGTTGVPSSWSDTAITVPVPTGATTGSLVVTANGVASSPYTFMVTPATQPPGVHFIQGDYAIATSVPSSISTPFPIAQTAGNLNVVAVGYSGLYLVNTISDTAGNTYVLAAGPTAGSSRKQSIYYAKNIAGSASNTVTVTFRQQGMAPAGPLAADIRVAEYSGLDPSAPLDVVAAATNTSSTADSGPATTTNQNDLLVGAAVADGMATGPGTNYTSRVLPVNYGPTNSDILEDRIVTATGSYNATAPLNISTQWVMQLVAFKEKQNQAPVVNAGPNQTITLPNNTATLQGIATDDGLPNNTLTISWTQVSGPGTATFNTPNQAITDATFPVAGTYVLQLTANDSQLSSVSSTTITVSGSNSLTLNPLIAGPDVPGSTQTFNAVLKTGTGPAATPISGVSVVFTVTGANGTTGSATTDSTGTATFTYTGANAGTDNVTASYAGQNSNSANVTWLVPTQAVSTTSVTCQFFSTGFRPTSFNIAPGTPPVFIQTFPSINFNPDPRNGPVPAGMPSTINQGTIPFTAVVTDANGNFVGSIAAQGNGYLAGSTPMGEFQMVCTGNFVVKTPGNTTFTISNDDGMIFGVGGGATPGTGNPMYGAPASGKTAFTNVPVMGANDGQGTFVAYNYVVNFPTAGTYPYEFDYFECCGFALFLTMTTGQNPGSSPTAGIILLTPTTPPSLNTGQQQTFTVQAVDATGAPARNIAVGLAVNGPNQAWLTGFTDVTGTATFQYLGSIAGTDTVQAFATISGTGISSNSATMTWSVPSGSPGAVHASQGWIGSPRTDTTIQGQVPITVDCQSACTLVSGTLSYWPASNPNAITYLPTQFPANFFSPVGTFDTTVVPNGGYTIQLDATTSWGYRLVSQITVNVVGENKPGRMKSTVKEFTVPLAGIPITITRTYDSIERNKVQDFGYGWKLGTYIACPLIPSKM